MHAHGHRPVALAGIYGLHSTRYLILQRGHLCAHKPTTVFSALLSSLPDTNPTQHPIRALPDSGTVHLTERHPFSDRLTKPPSDHPRDSPSQFTTKVFPNHQVRVHSKFSTKHPYSSPCRGPTILSNQKFFQITQIGSTQFPPRKTPFDDPSSHPFTRPRKIP